MTNERTETPVLRATVEFMADSMRCSADVRVPQGAEIYLLGRELMQSLFTLIPDPDTDEFFGLTDVQVRDCCQILCFLDSSLWCFALWNKDRVRAPEVEIQAEED